jgi:hypothetical protein
MASSLSSLLVSAALSPAARPLPPPPMTITSYLWVISRFLCNFDYPLAGVGINDFFVAERRHFYGRQPRVKCHQHQLWS